MTLGISLPGGEPPVEGINRDASVLEVARNQDNSEDEEESTRSEGKNNNDAVSSNEEEDNEDGSDEDGASENPPPAPEAEGDGAGQNPPPAPEAQEENVMEHQVAAPVNAGEGPGAGEARQEVDPAAVLRRFGEFSMQHFQEGWDRSFRKGLFEEAPRDPSFITDMLGNLNNVITVTGRDGVDSILYEATMPWESLDALGLLFMNGSHAEVLREGSNNGHQELLSLFGQYSNVLQRMDQSTQRRPFVQNLTHPLNTAQRNENYIRMKDKIIVSFDILQFCIAKFDANNFLTFFIDPSRQ
jgi:hypothetical protein